MRLGGFCARRSVSFSDSKHSNWLLSLFCALVCDAVTAGYACFTMIVFGMLSIMLWDGDLRCMGYLSVQSQEVICGER